MTKDDFKKANMKVRVTFGGWDGKSYNGEAVNVSAWYTPSYPEKLFVRTRKSVKGQVTIVYHEIVNEFHPVSHEQMVRVFTYFCL